MENEIKRIDLPVGLGEDGVFRADIGGNDVAAAPGLGGEHVVAGRRNEELPATLMHPVGELGRGRIFPDDEWLLKEEEAAVGGEGVEIEAGGKMLLGKGKPAEGLGEAAGTENPESVGIDVDGPAEPGLARATEEFDDLLIGGITKNHGLAATADERQIALGVALMEIGETKGERAPEFGSFTEDRTQLAFDLATVEALGEVTSFKASSGSTGPLRDSRIAERRRLLRVCSSISSAVTLRWFFGFMG